VPVVIQTIIAPLRPVTVRTAINAVKRRRRSLAAAAVVVSTMVFFGTLLFVIPGVVCAVCFNLYAPVSVMEELKLGATLKRAFNLMKRTWATVLTITILQFATPVAIWMLTAGVWITFKLGDDWKPRQFTASFHMSGKSCLFQLLNVLLTPLIAIVTALLYLKTRRAGGETLRDAMEQFDALEISRSRWQTRIRSRLISKLSSEKSAKSA
jgi:hypothetical protein